MSEIKPSPEMQEALNNKLINKIFGLKELISSVVININEGTYSLYDMFLLYHDKKVYQEFNIIHFK